VGTDLTGVGLLLAGEVCDVAEPIGGNPPGEIEKGNKAKGTRRHGKWRTRTHRPIDFTGTGSAKASEKSLHSLARGEVGKDGGKKRGWRREGQGNGKTTRPTYVVRTPWPGEAGYVERTLTR